SVTWSPYYKITTHVRAESDGGTSLMVSVNGIPHQRVTLAERREKQETPDTVPFEPLPAQQGAQGAGQTANPPPASRTPSVPGLDRVLIVGAGTGPDVAIALRHGAAHIDAVEIDPKLAQLGRDRNPDHVYSDPRVEVHVDDGRAFLERTDTKYNLILFALPDSLTL